MMKKILLLLFLFFCGNMVIAQRNNSERKSIIQFQSNGHFLQQIDSLQISTAQLPSKLNELLGLNSNYTFAVFNSQKDDIGMLHQSYQQFYKDIKIQDNMVLVHSKSDKVMALNGDVVLEDEINIIPNLTKIQAIQKAINNKKVEGEIKESSTTLLIATKLVEQNKKQTALCYEVVLPTLKVYVNAQNGEVFNELSLEMHGNESGIANTIYEGQKNIICDSVSIGTVYLRQRNIGGVNIETYDGTSSSASNPYLGSPYENTNTNWKANNNLYSIRINKPTGMILPELYFTISDASNNIVYTSSVHYFQIEPLTVLNWNFNIGQNYKINIWEYDFLGNDDFLGSFTIDSTEGKHIFSGLDVSNNYNLSGVYYIGNPALDAYWAVSTAEEYFKNAFGRNGYKNMNGDTVKLFLNHYTLQPNGSIGTNNAYAKPEIGHIRIGLGDNKSVGPLVDLDWMAHEFTHLITEWNGKGGLNYQNESGALNESFSDIFAMRINHLNNNTDWIWGNESGLDVPFFRDIQNPNNSTSPQPNFYDQPSLWHDYLTNSSDNGGVHTNSGVQNRWFYLLCAGGSQIGYSVPANVVGMDKASKICYNTLMHFLTPNATYVDARNTSLLNTLYLYGYNSPEYLAVESAWNAVNVLDPGNIPPQTCVGDIILTSNFDFFNDGSGSNTYSNYNNCSWLIQPANGASSIQLWFDSFDLNTGDTLWIYEGSNSNGNLISAYTNPYTPPLFTTTGGAFYLKFKSNWKDSAQGFSAHYLATMNTAIGDYEYWFDNNYGNKVVGNNPNNSNLYELAINATTANLTPSQIHTFHIRCKNSIGLWSSVLSHDFYSAGQSKISSYEYWFDENINNKVSQTLASPISFLNINSLNSPISAATLSHGIHNFHFRAKNELGVWSSEMSHLFYKSNADNIAEYEYWFDEDYAAKVTTPITSPQGIIDLNVLNSNFSTASLAGGLHTFHFRTKNTSAIWSSTLSHTFYKYSGSGLVSYQYWFDDDFSNVVSASTANPLSILDVTNAINVSNLSKGVHRIHFRSMDESGYWSAVLSHDFYNAGQSKINTYEYWFDEYINNKVSQSLASPVSFLNISPLNSTISAAALSNGIHNFHFRAKNELGVWSSVMSHSFYKSNTDNISEYEYWFDDDYNTKVTTPINSPQSVVELNIMNSNFSTANLAGGLHTFHFRAKNTSTVWSSVISHTFYKYSGSGLVSYQYWFDDDFSNAINSSTTGPMSMIDINNAISVSNLNNGLHKLHFRSKDESGYWSSVISHDFFIMGAKLVAYEYWFNSDYSNKVVQSIALSNEYSLQTTFNVNTLALGSNVVNIRFKDNAGMWSSTLTHGFCKGIGDSAISIKFLLEGFYAGNHQMHAVLINQGVSNDNSITDSVEVQLRNSTTPFGLVASKYISQKKNGLVEFDMPTVPSGFYYIVVKHRNSLETWSSAPVYKGDCSMSYDFTAAATQAYGDNQVEVEQGVFAIYTGDINQDGFVDSFDFPALDTDIFNGVSGVYVNTDLNGDGFVDSFDFPLFDVNSFNGVTVMTP